MSKRLAGMHVIDWTPEAKVMASQIRGAAVFKTLALDRDVLEDFAVNNPGSIRIYRYYDDPDATLDNWRALNDQLVHTVQDYVASDLINVVEVPYNERFQSAGDNIKQYETVSIDAADDLRDRMMGVKIAGGNFGVGNPPGTQADPHSDLPLYFMAFSHFDYLSLHHYAWPEFSDEQWPYYWGRFAGIYEWAARNKEAMPPLILTEFGLDHLLTGSGADGWRSIMSAQEYADKSRKALSRIARYTYVAGVCFFATGVNASEWQDYDVAGHPEFVDLFNSEIEPSGDMIGIDGLMAGGIVTKPLPPIADAHPIPVRAPVGVKVAPASEFNEWAEDPRNEHDSADKGAYLKAFIAKREASAGVAQGTYGVQDALAGGYPRNLLPMQDELPAQFTAQALSVPVERIQAIDSVESAGQAFGAPCQALIRFEAHLWLDRVPPARKSWAAQAFRVVDGIEQVRLQVHGNWEPLQEKSQVDRWVALTMATVIDRNTAFECTSMGRFQILGEHYKRLGYLSAENMLQILSQSEGAQWHGFEKFIESDTDLHIALVNGDAAQFAKIYNGEIEPYRSDLIAAGWK